MKILSSYSVRQGRLKHTQSGMTLIEVLIAMFVLAVGILALLSVQLRAVSGVREAESQTIVSQITQNLVEGMMINPELSVNNDRVSKSYNAYITKGKKVSSSSSCNYADSMTKKELAAAQVANFECTLSKSLPDSPQIYFTICQDSSGEDPDYKSGSFNAKCNNSGNDTVIKVLWLSDAEEDQSKSGLKKADGNYVIYTHQSRVTR